ncbi:MAG: SH3 domain-containing protein [Pseudomonadota bacterium]
MWRLIIVTFGVLALVFYELSGGADYSPIDNSVQRHGMGPHLARVEDESGHKLSASVASTSEGRVDDFASRVEATLASLPVARVTPADTTDQGHAAKVSALTTTQNGPTPDQTAEDAAVVAALQDASAEMREVWPGAIELFARAEQEAEIRVELRQQAKAEARDVRFVEGDVANMRGGPGTEFRKITSLGGGTQVLVLDTPGNGWLNVEVVETGEVGWMADWLVSTPSDIADFSNSALNGSGLN